MLNTSAVKNRKQIIGLPFTAIFAGKRMMYLLDIANAYGIDLSQAMALKIAKNEGRRWN